MSESLSIKKTIRGSVPRIPFGEIARAILGAEYELSLVICGDSLAHRMNTTYRQKTYFPNVLSFPLADDAGEIFLNARKAEREARLYGTNVRKRLAFLFVHGGFHLKGLDHGRTMERSEENVLRRFHLL